MEAFGCYCAQTVWAMDPDDEAWLWVLAPLHGASLGGADRTARLGWSFISSLRWSHSAVMLTFFESQVSTVPPGGELGCSLFTGRPVFKAWGWRAHSMCAGSGLGSGQLAWELRKWFWFFFAIILKSRFPSSILKILNILWMQGKFKDELLNIVTQIK